MTDRAVWGGVEEFPALHHLSVPVAPACVSPDLTMVCAHPPCVSVSPSVCVPCAPSLVMLSLSDLDPVPNRTQAQIGPGPKSDPGPIWTRTLSDLDPDRPLLGTDDFTLVSESSESR